MNKLIFLLIVVSVFVSGCSSDSSSPPSSVTDTAGAELLNLDNDVAGLEPANTGIDGSGEGVPDELPNEGIAGSGEGVPDPLPIPTKPGQAMLGPVVKADVTIYNIENLSEKVCEAKTADSVDLQVAGTFRLPIDCIELDELYLVVVSGGFDIDSDDDGVIYYEDDDEAKTPTPVNGKFHALLLGRQMKIEGWKVSSLTELVFEALAWEIANNTSVDEVMDIANRLAPITLNRDINGDNEINYLDMVLWNPGQHGETILTEKQMVEFVDSIHTNKNLTVGIRKPYRELIRHIDSLVPVKSIYQEGELVYIATINSFAVVDVSNLEESEILYWYPTGPISSVWISGGYAFIRLGKDIGLQVLNISVPKNITMEKFISGISAFSPSDVANGDFYTLEEIIISNGVGFEPSFDTVLVSYAIDVEFRRKELAEIKGRPVNLVVSEDVAYISYIDSVGNPDNVFLDAVDIHDYDKTDTLFHWNYNEEAGGTRGLSDFQILGDYLVIHRNSLVDVYDISNPGGPHFRKRLTEGFVTTSPIRMDGNFLMADKRSLGNETQKDTFIFWDYKTLKVLGEMKVHAFEGAGISSIFDYIDSTWFAAAVSGWTNQWTLPIVQAAAKLEEILNHPSAYVAYLTWGDMSWIDFDFDTRGIYFATGVHGIQIVERPVFLDE